MKRDEESSFDPIKSDRDRDSNYASNSKLNMTNEEKRPEDVVQDRRRLSGIFSGIFIVNRTLIGDSNKKDSNPRDKNRFDNNQGDQISSNSSRKKEIDVEVKMSVVPEDSRENEPQKIEDSSTEGYMNNLYKKRLPSIPLDTKNKLMQPMESQDDHKKDFQESKASKNKNEEEIVN